jgi:hypothetical protein
VGLPVLGFGGVVVEQAYIEWRRERARIPVWLVLVQMLLVVGWSLVVGVYRLNAAGQVWLSTAAEVGCFWLTLLLLAVAHEGAHLAGQRHYGVRCRLVFGWYGLGIAPLGPVVREQKLVTCILPHLVLTPPLVLGNLLLHATVWHALGFWLGVAAALNTILGLHDLYSWWEWFRLPRGTRAVRHGQEIILYLPRRPVPFDPGVPPI